MNVTPVQHSDSPLAWRLFGHLLVLAYAASALAIALGILELSSRTMVYMLGGFIALGLVTLFDTTFFVTAYEEAHELPFVVDIVHPPVPPVYAYAQPAPPPVGNAMVDPYAEDIARLLPEPIRVT